MIKSMKVLLTSVVLVLFSATIALSQPISVQLDGDSLQFDQPPEMVGGRLLVPLRGIFEALKADVVYDAETRAIQATKENRVIQLQLGSRTAVIDGRTVFLDVPADTIGGRTMVPLRFVSEALGADVKWEGATKTVLMNSDGSASDDAAPPASSSGEALKVDRIIHSGTRTLKPGDTLSVVAYGSPGAQASFEILGKTSSISLPEVSSGKYETRWNVPQGLQVIDGVLVVSLRKDSRETAMESSQLIFVETSTPSSSETGWKLTPADGETTSEARPSISLTFPNDIRSNTVRFYVDGVDFTNQVRVNGREVSWTPGYDLDPTEHRAEARATSSRGQSLSQSWNFKIDPNAGFDEIGDLRPAEGASVGLRPQIGILFKDDVSAPALWLDGRRVVNQQGLQVLRNGILWTPTSDLAAGEHTVRVRTMDRNRQTLDKTWTFQVGVDSITDFTLSSNTVSLGDDLKVRLVGPVNARGVFAIGNGRTQSLTETSPGVYEGTYTAGQRDRGTQAVRAQLNLPNGQILRQNAAEQVTFTAEKAFTVINLSDGASVDERFTVQGKAPAGATVSVAVEYSRNNILELLIGQTRTIRAQAVANAAGNYVVPVDASALKPGQQMRLTVSTAGQDSVELNLTRR